MFLCSRTSLAHDWFLLRFISCWVFFKVERPCEVADDMACPNDRDRYGLICGMKNDDKTLLID